MQATTGTDRQRRAGPARTWMLALTAWFLAVHLAYHLAGVRFDYEAIVPLMHYLDVDLLEHDLVRGLWYLHIQPPLMNLLVGLGLKLFPVPAAGFYLLYLALGWAFALMAFLLQQRLGVRPWLAAVLSAVYMASPQFILWEHFLFYTFLCAVLPLAAALLLHAALGRWGVAPLAGFFTVLFLLCGFRSMFHLGWFVLLYLSLVFAARRHWRRVALAGVLPLLLVTGMYAKNLFLFGEFTTCTFVEKNLWINTVGNMGDEKAERVASGDLSPLSAVNRWASLDAYPETYKQVPPRFAGIPALTQTHKSTGGVNYNHYGNIAVCNGYGADAFWVLRNRPGYFLRAFSVAAWRYFRPTSDPPVSPNNQARLGPVLTVSEYLLFGQMPWMPPSWHPLFERLGGLPCLFLLAGLPFLYGYGLWRAWRGQRPERGVMLFIAFNVAMVFVLGCTFDFHETARYRFLTDGLSLCVLGVLAERILARRRG